MSSYREGQDLEKRVLRETYSNSHLMVCAISSSLPISSHKPPPHSKDLHDLTKVFSKGTLFLLDVTSQCDAS